MSEMISMMNARFALKSSRAVKSYVNWAADISITLYALMLKCCDAHIVEETSLYVMESCTKLA